MDYGVEASADRLRRLYAGGSGRDIYGIRGLDALTWHREQDERRVAKAWLAEHGALPCGHHASNRDVTVETRTEFCRLCDLMGRARDAERMERELTATQKELIAAVRFALVSLSQSASYEVPPVVVRDVAEMLARVNQESNLP